MSKPRPLHADEIKLARLVFAEGIDYARVRIHRGIACLPDLPFALAPNGHIYFPRRHCPDDFSRAPAHYRVWLIHELTHVWQHQHGHRVWLGGLFLALKGGYRRRSAYVYPPLCSIGSLADLNMEQQADLIAHYYAAKFLARPPYAAELPRFQAALAGFLADPHDKALLPRYRNTLKWFA